MPYPLHQIKDPKGTVGSTGRHLRRTIPLSFTGESLCLKALAGEPPGQTFALQPECGGRCPSIGKHERQLFASVCNQTGLFLKWHSKTPIKRLQFNFKTSNENGVFHFLGRDANQ